jgi:hypothetical protein
MPSSQSPAGGRPDSEAGPVAGLARRLPGQGTGLVARTVPVCVGCQVRDGGPVPQDGGQELDRDQ